MVDRAGGAVTLVLGGARSGKSSWAERLATDTGRPVLFVATAEPLDDEMRERIAAHRAHRPSHWQTVEVTDDLVGAVGERAGVGAVILVDCLTLWVSNVIGSRTAHLADATAVAPNQWREIESVLLTSVNSLIQRARREEQNLILVSNEVGLGLVPPYPLGRGYRDALGRVNAAVAQQADTVVLMVAGLAVDVKRLAIVTQRPMDTDGGRAALNQPETPTP